MLIIESMLWFVIGKNKNVPYAKLSEGYLLAAILRILEFGSKPVTLYFKEAKVMNNIKVRI